MTAGPEEPPSRGKGPRALRIVLAAVASIDAVFLAEQVHDEGVHPRSDATPSALSVSLSALPVVVGIVVVVVVALALFGRRRRPFLSGVVALVGLGVLTHIDAGLRGGPRRVFFSVGATLAGWLFGHCFALRLRRVSALDSAHDDLLAEAGASAALAATYVGAGLSKLSGTGLLWADETTLRATILVNHAVDDTSTLAAYARLVVDHPALAHALSLLTLIIQVGAFVYVLGPRARKLWGVLLLAFHLNVFLLTGILYFQACVLLIAFSFLPSTAAVPALPEGAPRQAARGVTGWVGLAVALAWIVRLARG